MNQNSNVLGRQSTRGEAAVDGLLSGILAGLIMAALLVAGGLLSGFTVLDVLSRFDPSPAGASSARAAAPALVGLAAHLAVSGIYGLIFGFLYRLLNSTQRGRRLPTWLPGVVYGLLLFAFARALWAGGALALMELPFALLILGHIVYGAVLGLLLDRQGR